MKYEAGRVSNPDRIFFDLHDTKLASTLVGKTFEVSDGFLRRVRVAQFQKGMVRVVLEVDDVSDYSAFLLPNPYRLIIDIHGRKPNAPQTLVARAQQEEEKQSSVLRRSPGRRKPESSPRPPPRHRCASATPQPDAAATRVPPAGTAAPASKPAADFGPRMADGSFFSHRSAAAADIAAKTTAGSDTSPLPVGARSAAASRRPGHRASPLRARPRSPRKSEVANLDGPELKATDKPTSEPTVQVVAPRGSG